MNGNGDGKRNKCSLNILQWNLGSRHWQRKRDQVQAMADERAPDIFAITEANLFNGIPEIQTNILGYNMIKPLTHLNPKLGYSRVLLFVKYDLNFEVMKKHMDTRTSSIWIKLTKKGHKKLILGALYREQTLLKQDDGKKSAEEVQQVARWRLNIKQWQDVTKDNDAIIVGDMNLDFVTWDNPEQNVKTMVEDMKSGIEMKGFQQITKGVTRSWKGTKDSLLDQVWTNAPHRVLSTLQCSERSSRP